MTCTICREGYFRTANSSAFKCVACNSSDCAVCSSTAASMCTKCKSSVSKVVVAGVCTANVTNCKADTATATYNVGGTSVTCTECATNYIKKSDGSACLDCTSVTNCTTHVAASDNSACKCSLCTFNTVTDVYYYINSTGTCTNTNPSNCGYFDSNGIAANCYYCNVGYKWKKTATTAECTACNSTDFKCTVGADACAGLNYPGKPSAAAAAAAANSSIISLVLSLLLALITLLI